jgi:hypothetical protein
MLVEAENGKEALSAAETDCESMVERGIIDWFDMDGRWGTSKAYGVNSVKGKKLLKEGMDSNRSQFDRALAAIRYMMENYSDDQIYNEQFDEKDKKECEHYLSRYQFNIAYGGSNNPSVYCIDGNLWGSRVDNDKDLAHILENKEGRKLWVVPVDVHN